MKGKVFQAIYRVVKTIPKGKVATYGQIARKMQKLNDGGMSLRQNPQGKMGRNSLKVKRERFKLKITPNVVGWALHQNQSLKVPCHRAVDRRGKVALNYGFGGAEEQKRKLEEEGIRFKDKIHVNLEKHLIDW